MAMNATQDPQTRAGAIPAPLTPPPSAARASFRLTREGGYWLLAAAVLWLIGMYKGINLLSLVASFMLIFWAFNAFAARRAVRPLRLRRWLDGPLFARTP